jgi:hypothetical protein
VELEELRGHMARVEVERATKAVQLSQSVMEISDALVDLCVFPIRHIPTQPRSARDVLMVVSLVLERLQEEHASSTGPWVISLARLASLQPQAIPPAVFFVLSVCM